MVQNVIVMYKKWRVVSFIPLQALLELVEAFLTSQKIHVDYKCKTTVTIIKTVVTEYFVFYKTHIAKNS